ncbi:MAG: archaeosine biosynthesis radical SAM protein RaSEA [Candidatus Hodarchaeota archaeon]
MSVKNFVTRSLEDPDFSNEIKTIRSYHFSNIKKKEGLSAKYWIENDRLLKGVGKALTIILPTKGCSWALSKSGGCSMCGYINDAVKYGAKSVSDSEKLVYEFEKTLKNNLGKEFEALKIFTSGSFFDESELSKEAQKKIFETISNYKNISEVVVESRPEYVTSEKIEEAVKTLSGKTLEVGIGLETSSDIVRSRCINKGFSFQDFSKAVHKIIDGEARVKAYILIKPPFLSEKEAINDAIKSAIDASKVGTKSISFNPCNVQSGTLVEKLWKNKSYRPPWLWSIIEVLKKSFNTIKSEVDRIICDPVAGGKSRGPHNCGKCDKKVLQAIRKTSLNQDPELLNVVCDCYEVWKTFLEYEAFSQEPDPSFILSL